MIVLFLLYSRFRVTLIIIIKSIFRRLLHLTQFELLCLLRVDTLITWERLLDDLDILLESPEVLVHVLPGVELRAPAPPRAAPLDHLDAVAYEEHALQHAHEDDAVLEELYEHLQVPTEELRELNEHGGYACLGETVVVTQSLKVVFYALFVKDLVVY
jgi:hypothetical protein